MNGESVKKWQFKIGDLDWSELNFFKDCKKGTRGSIFNSLPQENSVNSHEVMIAPGLGEALLMAKGFPGAKIFNFGKRVLRPKVFHRSFSFSFFSSLKYLS